MGSPLFFMGMSVGCMIPGEDWFVNRLVGGMRKRVVKRMMLCILQVTVPVHSRPLFGKRVCLQLRFWYRASGRHNH
jgi:hypothetical protein